MYIGDPVLQTALDAIRLVANPDEKGLAHVTVKGPYAEHEHLDTRELSIEGTSIDISGVGDFFADDQNTVFLQCQSDVLKRVWDKPDFSYRPHIAIYDGPSFSFAQRLATLLREHPLRCTFPATRLSRMLSEKGQHRDDLRTSVQLGSLSWLTDQPLNVDDLQGLSQARRLALIQGIWKKLTHIFPGEETLWGTREPSSGSSRHAALWHREQSPRRDLYHIVSEAYRMTRRQISIDRLIADPSEYATFVSRCWQLGAEADQFTLGRTLLNARKAGEIGSNPLLTRTLIPRKKLDRYLIAVEVAVRIVQDEEWEQRQHFVGLDHILCHPLLSTRLQQFASHLAPGHAASDYRWAALVLRKSGRNQSTNRVCLHEPFERIGLLTNVKHRQIPHGPGFLWLRYRDQNVYIGEAEDLSTQVRCLLEHQLDQIPIVQPLVNIDLEKTELAIAPEPASSPSGRQFIKRLLVEDQRPRMNLLGLRDHDTVKVGVA